MTRWLKWPIAKAIALYASGYSRERAAKETGVLSITIRRNLERFLKCDQWNQLERFISRHFNSVTKSDMKELQADILACQERLISPRERSINAYVQMKAKTQKARNSIHRRAATILKKVDPKCNRHFVTQSKN
jgi:hypothetical protein